jgi:hypothetical protein
VPLPTEAPPPSARTVPIAQEHPRVGATAGDCFARCDVVELTIELTTMQRSDGAGASLRNATHSAVRPRVAGRLHGPDDAQVEPREVDVGRRAIAHRSDI